ncbi:MAG: hypothetical protein M1817_005869 [Caeruleum heppii]|nr:MAG: hypothetical protein M1817_005869 [Caeruleum heppii]
MATRLHLNPPRQYAEPFESPPLQPRHRRRRSSIIAIIESDMEQIAEPKLTSIEYTLHAVETAIEELVSRGRGSTGCCGHDEGESRKESTGPGQAGDQTTRLELRDITNLPSNASSSVVGNQPETDEAEKRVVHRSSRRPRWPDAKAYAGLQIHQPLDSAAQDLEQMILLVMSSAMRTGEMEGAKKDVAFYTDHTRPAPIISEIHRLVSWNLNRLAPVDGYYTRSFRVVIHFLMPLMQKTSHILAFVENALQYPLHGDRPDQVDEESRSPLAVPIPSHHTASSTAPPNDAASAPTPTLAQPARPPWTLYLLPTTSYQNLGFSPAEFSELRLAQQGLRRVQHALDRVRRCCETEYGRARRAAEVWEDWVENVSRWEEEEEEAEREGEGEEEEGKVGGFEGYEWER